MELLNINDIFVQICNYLQHINIIIKLEQLSSHHKKTIRADDWMLFTVVMQNMLFFDFVIETYNFKCYSFHNNKIITDGTIKKLKNCHTLDLSNTDITDLSVVYLKNCHTLNLSDTNITDKSVIYFKNCHTL